MDLDMLITRRNILRIGVASLASGAIAGCRSTTTTKPADHGFIDAHAHIWSDDLAKYPLGPWATPANMKPATFTDDELLTVVKPHGIDRVVLIQHAPLHGYDNSYILDCARKRPDTFSVVAMINERTPNLKERLRDLRDQGARGIRIGATKHADRTLNVDPPNWLKAPGMQLLWQYAAELGVAVCPLLSADFLPTVEPMCARNPDTTVVIDHFGRITMGNKEHAGWLTALAKHKNVYIKVSAFKNFGDKRAPYGDLVPLMRLVIDAFGHERLMWGSDLPYQLNDGNTYGDAVALIRDEMQGLADTERNAILRETAAGVFF